MGSDGFLLGHVIDPASDERSGEDVDYDPSDLTTHGVIVGMTGSGKTGLGVVVLEEALQKGLPALIIDPKGDMGNLLLMFPEFRPADFEPWVIPDKSEDRTELAARTAELWKKGVSGWDPDLQAIAEVTAGSGFTIYTPGSSAGVPLNIVGSLDAPPLDWDTEAETLRDEIEGFVSSLLMLAGIEADPISSREHILLSNVIEHSWRQGRSLDLAGLIAQVQDPPLRKLGVFEVDTFFPAKDRTALAMRLNGLVASPSFAAWMEGPPLDIASMLATPDGKPRAAVVYLAHLSEEERQFVVTLLLSKVVTWMRGLPGTPDLRALVYMDEVFGFAPPTAAPPSKKPILTILKQARAFGVGMILSTQNPVDLDYKAMSNSGTWMVGRLQTERDKARILEALQSASGGTDIGAIDEMISGLGKRRFVLHNTREPAPQVFTTRWAMSYLRGPLTREEISVLTEDAPERAAAAPQAAAAETAAPAAPAPELADDESAVAPQVASGVPVYYLDPAAGWADRVGAEPGGARLTAALAARVHLTFDETRAKVNHRDEWEALFHPLGERVDPGEAIVADYDGRDFRSEPPEGAAYVLPSAPIKESSFFKEVSRDLVDHLYRNHALEIFANRTLKLYSRVGETRAEFEERCDRAAQEEADTETAKIRDRLESKMDTVKDQLAAAHRRMEELEVDVASRRRDSLLTGAGDLVGMLLGGKRSTRSLSRASSKRSEVLRTEQRLRTAEAKVQDKVDRLAELEEDLAAEIIDINDRWEEAAAEIETVEIGLEKNDISVDEVALVWVPTG